MTTSARSRRPRRTLFVRAGQEGRRRREGHQEEPLLRRRLPVLPVRPGLLEHPQLPPAGRGRRFPLDRAAPTTRRTGTTQNYRRPGRRRPSGRSTRPSATRCCTTPRRSSTTRAATSSGASATRSTASRRTCRASSPACTSPWATTTSRPSRSRADRWPWPTSQRSPNRWRRSRRRGDSTAPSPGRCGWPAGIGLAVLTLWLVSILVFVATTALGDPVRAILGRDYAADKARVAAAHGAAEPRRAAAGALPALARRPAHRGPGHLARQPATGLRADRPTPSSTRWCWCCSRRW